MMKFKLYQFALLFCLFYSGTSKNEISGTETLTASSLKPYGRYLFTNDKHLELISSAAHVGVRFTGKQCEVFAYVKDEGGHNYLQYELDGVYQKRIKITGKERRAIIITAHSDGKHSLWIYKATEAHTGPVFIEKVMGTGVSAIKKSAAPLIEFIGNSITCGAAADPSEMPCGTGAYHDQHNAYNAYGPRVARALKANFILSGVSGIGIYRNWNSDGPTMPQVYEQADFQFGGQRPWDFKTYKPDVVSIALGTNDNSNGDGKRERLPFDSTIFVNTYINFVKLIKSKYPSTQIALLSSPMVHGDRREKLQRCLTAVKQHIDAAYPTDKPASVFFFKPMQAKGCSGHPNVEDHAILAEEVAPFFKKLL